MLKKHHTMTQWTSIFALAIGVAVVQLSFMTGAGASAAAPVAVAKYAIGLTAIAVSAVTSGFAGVYTEKVIKHTPTSLWMRNIQMTLISLVLALGASLSKDFNAIRSYGFFSGYNPLVMTTIALQALGGILISLVVKHASSVTKAFATSLSIVVSCIFSALYLKDCTLTSKFFIGVGMVCAASVSYSLGGKKAAPSTGKLPTQEPQTSATQPQKRPLDGSLGTNKKDFTVTAMADTPINFPNGVAEIKTQDTLQANMFDDIEMLTLDDDFWMDESAGEIQNDNRKDAKSSSVYLFSRDLSFLPEDDLKKVRRDQRNRFTLSSYEFNPHSSRGNSTNYPRSQ
jgi:UDP-sugar transporter A1/2/3